MQQQGDSVLMLAGSVTGTSYTPSKTDSGRVLEVNNPASVTVTLPTVAVAGWQVGTIISIFQEGAGQVTVAAAGGVTLRSNGAKLKTAAQYAVIFMRMRANDEWSVYGDTAA